MGFSQWSDQAYKSRQTHRQQTHQSAFTYDHHVRTTGAVKVHDQMNPYGAVRESRDSNIHPESVSIGVLFDVTGSMGSVPRVLQTKLGALMRVLIQNGYLGHPQILFGAVGDAYTDRVPLQIGQFEAGLEMDDDLGKIYLEGGGGGQVHESYELGIYFIARHTRIDCWEKRRKKGYLFTIGDEKPYAVVRRQQVLAHLGDRIEEDIAVAEILAEVQERYEHFHIVPTNTSHGQSAEVQERWRELLGERLLILEDERAVCETIALAIGLCEGKLDDLYNGGQDLAQAGYDPTAVAVASAALTGYVAARAPIVRIAHGTLPMANDIVADGRL
jgi:hypothetical protein